MKKNKIFGNFVENIDTSIQHKEKIMFKSAVNISLLYFYYNRYGNHWKTLKLY